MDDHQLRRARAGLTQVIEPADALGVVSSQAWGPLRLLEIIQGATPTQQEWQALTAHDPENEQLAKKITRHLGGAIERWRRRSTYLKPDEALGFITRIGGRFLIPEDEQWPAALADLGVTEPLGLWIMGDTSIPMAEHLLGLVGSREATSYGEAATKMLAHKARQMGITVLSGGAYGIDAHAHRQALLAEGPAVPTIAVLAGGLDRFYPAGNVELLREIVQEGLLVTEMPPGMRPNRYRFLNRNRLIAALSTATIVVEARYRSGALNTANHAHDLGRIVGAVPGPIHAPSSAGCHRLIKETPSILIDDPSDLESIYGDMFAVNQRSQNSNDQRHYDMLSVEELLVFDALPVRGMTTVEHLCGITGLAVPMITGILTKLERHELAELETRGWRKHRNTRS
ncbi:DNA-processing protein DprA [Enteractinococcus coprophilus]|uniref:DNA processing protein n=1 Tax=Enteractinococcus coprophilus TaxID=1027633 RepID=A0A543AIP0_9MICC|nr:DNA-processing protein DprA [Enteractinococcus coprophilus]TQL72447.1 DNA processing protein [Enteractinococcus coprophilus]